MRIAPGFCRGFMTVVAAALGAVLWLATATLPASAATVKEVADTYADIALAAYEDATSRAKALKDAIEGLIAAPSDMMLGAARTAWKAARVPYMQTEAFRFGNKIVDDWEGKVNSWPLDEGLIDYVDASYGNGVGQQSALRRQRHRQQDADGRRSQGRRKHRSPRSCSRDAAGSGADRGQCRDRLSRDRVPAVGTGSQRHRARRRHAPRDRLRPEALHGRQLRPARRLPDVRHRSAGRRSRVRWSRNWKPSGAARKALAGLRHRSAGGDLHRARQPLLRRAGGRAHEARPAAARSRGGARLLLRQHPQLALLRRHRDRERLPGPLHADRRDRRSLDQACPIWSRRSRPTSTTACARRSPSPSADDRAQGARARRSRPTIR